MDYRQFKKILEQDETEKRESIDVLMQFVNEFPYFQTAQSLLAKAMHEQQHVRYDRQLKVAAAYSADRKSLYDLIHPKRVKLFSNKESADAFQLNDIVKEKEGNVFIAPEENVLPPQDDLIFSKPFEEPKEFIREIRNENIEEVREEVPVEITIPSKVDYEKLSWSPVTSYDDGEMQTEPDDYYDEKPVADPHEIIRKRLSEILGVTDEGLNVNDKKALIEVEKKEIVNDFKEKTESPVEKVEEEEIKEVRSNEIPEEKTSEEKSVDSISNTNVDSIERLVQQSKTAVDSIDKGEIEYALEASILQSLEKLPVLEPKQKEEKAEEKNIVQESPVISESKSHTFFEWLKIKSESDYGKVEIVHAYESEALILEDEKIEESNELRPDSKATDDIIDRFIATDPKIVASKAEFYSPANQAKKSITEDNDLVSETLAGIYRQQGHLQKARNAYQKLSLLYPEKLAFFAALILDIDKEISSGGSEKEG